MNEEEIRQLLNLPAESPFANALDDGTFQLQFDGGQSGGETVATAKDQIIHAVSSFEQLAMIVCIYHRGKYGVPIPPVVVEPENEPDNLNFHLQTDI